MTTPLHGLVRNSNRLAESSKKSYLADLDRWIAFAGSDLAKWTRYRAEEFYNRLLHVEKLKPQSATRIMTSLRYAAQRWASLEHKPELDFTQIEFAKNTKAKIRRALMADQATKLLETCRGASPEDMRDLAYFVSALETGMRQMSTIAMTLEGTGQLAGYPFPVSMVPLKGERDERFPIPLSNTAMLAIEPWIAFLKRNGVKKGLLFRSIFIGKIERTIKINDGLSHKTLYNIVQRRAVKAGIGHVHPHLFRHTFVTWRLTANVPHEQIAAITGHRLKGDELASLFDYADKQGEIAELARKTTPSWLAELVKEIVNR